MKNFILTPLMLFLFLMITVNCLLADTSLEGVSNPKNGQFFCLNTNFSEKLLLPIENIEFDRFKLVHKANDPGTKMWVQEWVPKDQDLSNWKEMISITYTRSKPRNVEEFEKNLQKSMAFMYYGSKYDSYLIRKTKDEYFYMLEVPNGHKEAPRFYTITRVIFTSKAVHTVNYEKRECNFKKSDQMAWAERLDGAYLGKE